VGNVPIYEIKERKFNPFFLWGFGKKKTLDAPFDAPTLLSKSLAQKNMLTLFLMHKLFLSGMMKFNES